MARESSPLANRADAVVLDRLLGALPEQNDLAPLRQALLRASTGDATRAWSRSNAYATVDKRVVAHDAILSAVADAKRAQHMRVDALYDAIGEVLDYAGQGNDAAAAMRLIAVGESAEAEENYRAACAYYEVAARFSEPLADRRVRIVALRRLARAHGALGEIDRAMELFRVCLEQATTINDIEAQIFLELGIGNIMLYQGRYEEAQLHYATALEHCGSDFPKLRGQLRSNLATTSCERGDLDGCEEQLKRVTEVWDDLAPADQCVWYNTRGLMLQARNDLDAAETSFRQAFEVNGSEFARAMVLDNLSELYVRRGNLSDAETYARSAEELALRAASPRALAEIYTRLGKIFRLRADLNGVTFFEKALEICRGHSYPLTEANAYLEYGIFRRTFGDVEEARSYLERARQICAELGAAQLERVASAELARL